MSTGLLYEAGDRQHEHVSLFCDPDRPTRLSCRVVSGGETVGQVVEVDLGSVNEWISACLRMADLLAESRP